MESGHTPLGRSLDNVDSFDEHIACMVGMVQKGVRYGCAKHPTNLRPVPGRPGNGT